jgi:hypothetical protein
MGGNNEIVGLSWTNPAASTYDAVVITFTPLSDIVTQPLSVPKGDSSLEISGLVVSSAYTFTVKAVKNEKPSAGKRFLVKADSVNPEEALPAAMQAATGAGTLAEPCTVVLSYVDLSIRANVVGLMNALGDSAYENGGKAYYNLDLSKSSSSGWTRYYPLPGAEKVVKLILPDDTTYIEESLNAAAPTFQLYTSLREVRGAGVLSVGQ